MDGACKSVWLELEIGNRKIGEFRKGRYAMAKQTSQAMEDVGMDKIRLDEIDKGPAHIRTHINEESLDELKDSIEKLGLLQPIVVIRKKKVKPDGRKYDLLIGSRRVLAHEKLGREEIHAIIIEKRQNKERILALSLAENMFRSRLSHKDTADAVTKLYKLYGKDKNKVAKATGMWPATVLRYVYLKEYGTTKMIKWVEDGDIKLLDVKRMLEAARWSISKAERMLEAMIEEGMTRRQKKDFAQYMKANPAASIKEGVKDARKPRITNKVLVDLTTEVQEGIQKAMKELKMDAEEVAFQALRDWLEDQGYIV